MNINSLYYFNSQICEFREQMGLKTFWADAEKVAAAKKAIGVLYLSLKLSEDEMEQAAANFQAAMVDFSRRDALLSLAGIYKPE